MVSVAACTRDYLHQVLNEINSLITVSESHKDRLNSILGEMEDALDNVTNLDSQLQQIATEAEVGTTTTVS